MNFLPQPISFLMVLEGVFPPILGPFQPARQSSVKPVTLSSNPTLEWLWIYFLQGDVLAPGPLMTDYPANHYSVTNVIISTYALFPPVWWVFV